MFFHPGRRDLADENRIILRFSRDDADVRGVAFIAGARVGDLDQLSFGHTVTSGVTSRLGISAGQYATISSTLGRPPPSPVTTGGPFRANGASSFVNRSTAARFSERTPMRSTTSANCAAISGEGSAAAMPWQALAPRNSVRTASKRRPS